MITDIACIIKILENGKIISHKNFYQTLGGTYPDEDHKDPFGVAGRAIPPIIRFVFFSKQHRLGVECRTHCKI